LPENEIKKKQIQSALKDKRDRLRLVKTNRNAIHELINVSFQSLLVALESLE